MDWPADNVERWPIAKLSASAVNPRQHSAEQVQQIAQSMREWGWTNPILVDESGRIIAGHGRILAAHSLGFTEAPVMVARGWSEQQKRAYLLADNKLALNASWDEKALRAELKDLKLQEFDVTLTGFSDMELKQMVLFDEHPNPPQDQTPLPDLPTNPISRAGDLWTLGSHRLICADSTKPSTWAQLEFPRPASLLHADPPYGMGKEADGVMNDNLTGKKLDDFQMAWWRAVRPHLAPNASGFIWGNAPGLWRLWYLGGLEKSEPMSLRNEIVWDKKTIAGMKSPDLTQYPEASERALFFQLGRFIFLVNQTKEDYWEGWDPIRLYMCTERERMGWKSADIKAIVNNHMHGHWFGKSQWSMITRENFIKLAAAAKGKAFDRDYDDLLGEYERIADIFKGTISGPRMEEHRSVRPYFDNAHETMRDVWEFGRVSGEERFGHATPKPVDLMERVVKSCTREGDLVLEPFMGTGATLLACEKHGRTCYGAELSPAYVDLTIERWQAETGDQALLPGGESFEEVKFARQET